MEARQAYKEPEQKAMEAFLQELKDMEGVKEEDRIMISARLSPLLSTPSVGTKLVTADLMWRLDTESPVLPVAFLRKGLGIDDVNNPLANEDKVIYLTALAKHEKAKELKSGEKSAYLNQIVTIASQALEQIEFERTPEAEIVKFQCIPGAYREMKRQGGFFQATFDRMRKLTKTAAPERTSQQLGLETVANLLLKLKKQGEGYEYAAIMQATSLALMIQIEKTTARKNGGGMFYALLKEQAGVTHSSQVGEKDRNLLADVLTSFIDGTTYDQWMDARPEHAPKFNVRRFRNQLSEELPNIKLCQHQPQSLPSFVATSVGVAAAGGILYTQSFALLAIAKKLHDLGLGKNTIILNLASHAGDKIKSCLEQKIPYVGKITGFFAKQGAVAFGQAAEESATTFSVTDGPGYIREGLKRLGAEDEPEQDLDRPTLDLFQTSMRLELMWAKEQCEEKGRIEFLQAVLELHEMLPPETKQRLTEKVKRKIEVSIPESVEAEEVNEDDSDLVPDAPEAREQVKAEEVNEEEYDLATDASEVPAESIVRGLGLRG